MYTTIHGYDEQAFDRMHYIAKSMRTPLLIIFYFFIHNVKAHVRANTQTK